jgi:hypothetical protein
MAAPQGGQKNYVTKPQQVYGEQYLEGGTLPVGAVPDFGDLFPASGGPYLNGTAGFFTLHSTDWVLTNKRTGVPIEAITDEEFTERYGGGGPPA